jgi:transcriptional regulator with GAF, ATPase, and Fis domain
MSERDRAELERRLQNVTERLLAAFEEIDFVHSMAESLARPEGVSDIDAYLLRETMALFRAEGGWVARSREAGFETVAAEGFPGEVTRYLTQSLVAPLAGRHGLPFLVDDLPGALVRQPDLLARSREVRPPDDALPRAFLAAPLEAGTEILGAVCLAKRTPGDVFTAGDSKLLNTLATQASLTIKNANLVERLRVEAKTLGRRVRQLESDARAHPRIDWIRGPSRAMKQVARQVEAAAGTDATVLLLGESGTGKSLIARVLHGLSARAAGAFVEVNCGAVAPGLIESELFGHARGAFTGADRSRPGLFEEANAGTILLDEVADLPLDAQVKLLNVLEQRRVRRVGENRDRPVDVRVVAATNADLTSAVHQGRFREDLFYRLNVISLTVPPLRQRTEDILHLAERFLGELARETNRRVEGFTPEAEQALVRYPWPGNVRELRNIVERSLLLQTHGGRVGVEDLPLRQAETALALPGAPLSRAVQDYEKALILESLRRHDGVVAKAAKALGISRTNLHNKLRKHDLIKAQSWHDDSQES